MNQILSTDLWFPDQPDPLSLDPTGPGTRPADPARYVVWVDPGRGSTEQAPRLALHLAECRNGGHP